MHSPMPSNLVIASRFCEECHPIQSLAMFPRMRSLGVARDDNVKVWQHAFSISRMEKGDYSRSSSPSNLVIPSRSCEESHPIQSLAMSAKTRSLGVARDDNVKVLQHAFSVSKMKKGGHSHSSPLSNLVIPSRSCEESHPTQSLAMFPRMRSLGVAWDDNFGA